MIDHTGVTVGDFEAGKAFYVAALGAIGYRKLMEFGPEITGSVSVAGFGEPPKPDFWISAGTPNRPALHVAFRVADRATVRAFHAAALAAGGTCNGPPASGPITTRTTMAPSCSIRTATTSRPSAMNRRPHEA